MRRKQRPSWWIFYLIWTGMTGLLAWDFWTPWQPTGQTVCAIVIVMVAYILIAWWLRSNGKALRSADLARSQVHNAPRRDLPMSPVQDHYLKAIARYNQH